MVDSGYANHSFLLNNEMIQTLLSQQMKQMLKDTWQLVWSGTKRMTRDFFVVTRTLQIAVMVCNFTITY